MKSIYYFRKFNFYCLILVAGIMFYPVPAFPQNGSSITGRIMDSRTRQNLPLAYIRFRNITDLDGKINLTASDTAGIFHINSVQPGVYSLVVTSVGYKKYTQQLIVNSGNEISLGNIMLQDSILVIGEAVVTGARPSAKLENNRTVFLMNKKILNSSGTALEALGFISGIKVDLKQNITLESGGNVLIFVDGIERNKSFVSQLNPSQIDKVEIINAPPSNFDGNASGVLNITTKKEKNYGINGQVLAEVPTSGSEIYLFPSYNLNYNAGKFAFFTSYNGEINYENIDESTTRVVYSDIDTTRISSNQYIRQKNLSHKFHYGMDFLADSQNILNFYGYVNSYSYEQDGEAVLSVGGADYRTWNALREETDHNFGVFNSIYYKRLSKENNKELTLDISNYHLNASNATVFNRYGDSQGSIINKQKPVQNSSVIKIDYTSPIWKNFKLNAGIKMRFQLMQDEENEDFEYEESTYAGYGSIDFFLKNSEVYAGLRIEDSETGLKNRFRKSYISFLPTAYFRHKTDSQQILNFSFNRTVNRPSIYQLNTTVSSDDPLAMRTGNLFLEPEFHNNLQAEHTIQFHSNILSYRLFYTFITNAINSITFLKESPVVMTQVFNAGRIHQYGIRLTGSAKFGILTFNPSLQFYNISTCAYERFLSYGIHDRNKPVFESAVSSVISLKDDLSFSLIFQYSTPKNNIQGNSYNQAIYFISANKTFNNRLKAGVVCALPFTRNFVYQGSDIKSPEFSNSYNGNLKLSAFPLWLRMEYMFSSGRRRESIKRDKEEIISKPKKGL
ncbi:MAG TPA: outer membrane beta-barrel protein [Bacteroidales bacterium]|nr:outer membrane beta-barrel protein [Bacteroidales bacterium]